LSLAAGREDGVGHPICGFIQLIVGKFPIPSLDGQPLRVLAHLIFEAIGDGLLDPLPPELYERLCRVKAPGTERLLFRRETRDIAERGWHGSISLF
jgi:hypothetical protein